MNPATLLVKKKNTRQLLEYLFNNGETSRVALAKAMDLSTATVTNLVTELMEQGLVYESRQESSAAGRKTHLLTFSKDIAYVITCSLIEIEEDYIRISLTDLCGNVLKEDGFHGNFYVSDTHTEVHLITEIISMIRSFMNTLSPSETAKICGIGICIGGMVDSSQLISVPTMNWRNLNLVTPLHSTFQVPVYAEGVTRIKALYELRWLDPSEKNVIYLNLSTGIGLVHFFNGKMIRGAYGIAGEIGHMSMNPDGPKCYCGNTGCFEQYCGMLRIMKKVGDILPQLDPSDRLYELVVKEKRPLTPKLVFQAFNEGSLAVYQQMHDVSRYLGAGLASIQNIYDPDKIVLSGYVDGEDDQVIRSAIIEARYRMVNRFGREIKVTRAHLKPEQTTVAIAMFVASRYLDELTK